MQGPPKVKMKYRSDFVVHIGAPKTATTFLQYDVFNIHQDIHNIGRPFGETSNRWFTEHICNAEINEYDKDRLSIWVDDARKFADEYDKKAVVLSDEALCRGRLNTVTAQRLSEIIPDAKILLTIRNQKTVLGSYYTSHGRILRSAPEKLVGTHLTFSEWFDFDVGRYPFSFLGAVRYYDLAKIYQTYFKRQNIYIAMYEDLIHDKNKYADVLSNVLNIAKNNILTLLETPARNKGVSGSLVKYLDARQKLPDWFRPSKMLPGGEKLRALWLKRLSDGKGFAPTFTQDEARWIAAAYGRGNALLKEEYGLPVEKYDYPLA